MNNLTENKDILARLEKIEVAHAELSARLATRALQQLQDGIVLTAVQGVSGGVKHINCDNNHLILNYPTPTAPTHLANKQYVDDQIVTDANKFNASILINQPMGSYLIFDSTTSDFSAFSFQIVYWYPTGNLFIQNTSLVSLNLQFNFNNSLNLSSLNTVPTDDSPSQIGLQILPSSARSTTINGNENAATTLNSRDSLIKIGVNLATVGATVTESASLNIEAHTTVAHTGAPDVLGVNVHGEVRSSLFNLNKYSPTKEEDHDK